MKAPVIDKALREQAFDILRRFMSGEFGIQELYRQWPRRSRDSLLRRLWSGICDVSISLAEAEEEERSEEECTLYARMAMSRALLKAMLDLPPGSTQKYWPFESAESLATAKRDAAARGFVADVAMAEKLEMQWDKHFRNRRNQGIALLKEYLQGNLRRERLQEQLGPYLLDYRLANTLDNFLQSLPKGNLEAVKSPKLRQEVRDVLSRTGEFLQTTLIYDWPRIKSPYDIPLVVLAIIMLCLGLLGMGHILVNEWKMPILWGLATFAFIFGTILAIHRFSLLLENVRLRRSLTRGKRKFWPFRDVQELQQARAASPRQE